MAQNYKNNPKIKLGSKNRLDKSYTETKNHKLRITSWIDGDIYDELNRRAELGESGGKYQTLMNDLLRAALFKNQGFPEDVDVVEIMKRIADLQISKQMKRLGLRIQNASKNQSPVKKATKKKAV